MLKSCGSSLSISWLEVSMPDASSDLTEAVSQVAAVGLALPERSCCCRRTRSKLASEDGPAWNGAVLKPE